MNNTIINKIIKRIAINRISTTEIADCLGKKGALPSIHPLNSGHFRVGKVFFVYAFNESNWELHEQIQKVSQGNILLVETHNCQDRAIFGDLVSKYLTLYRRVGAIVVNGFMRDAHSLIKENYPIWCKGVTPIGCFNKKNENELAANIINAWKDKYEGAIAVCDDSGVVIIPREVIEKEFLEKLEFMELQEDIWYYCIDTKKWSTFDTVCLKKYLNTGLLPKKLREKLGKFLKKSEK